MLAHMPSSMDEGMWASIACYGRLSTIGRYLPDTGWRGQQGVGPMASRVRRLDRSLTFGAFAVSFGITLTAVIVATHQRADHATDRPPGPVLLRIGTAGYLGPAALDGQWLVYSDKSTCADRAAGDGVSALRLSSSQIAWFFSDSSLGP